MPLNLNHVTIAGHLTRDPVVRTVGTQQSKVAEFGIAINKRWKTAEGEDKEDVTFVDCVAWKRIAELASEYLTKGSPVYIEGRLKLDTWEDKDGGKRSRLRVQIETLQFLASARERQEGDHHDANDGPLPPPAAHPTARRRERAPVGVGADEAPPF